MARPPVPAAPRPALQLIVFLAIAVAVGSFHAVLSGLAWWFVVVGVAAIVSLTLAIARRIARRSVWPPVAGLVAGLLAVTLFFAAGQAWLFLIPNLGTLSAFGALVQAGSDSIATQGIPADATVGIVFLLSAGFAVVTVLVDLLTFTVKRPALVGIPLLALIAVPALIEPSVSEPWFFILLAAAYLVLLLASSGRPQNRLAVGLGASAIVASLVLSVVLPSVSQDNSPSSRLRGYSTGVNPFINLGQDLRRPTPITALTYTTTSELDQYFTLSVLEDFSGGDWEPTLNDNGSTDLSNFDTAPGREAGATVEDAETTIEVGNVQGGWLPSPYAATSVTGVSGDWMWDPSTLTISSDQANMRDQKYTVETEEATPTATQLDDTGTRVDQNLLAKDLEVPSVLPDIVATTAQDVVAAAGATTNYQKALALQQYFRGGQFEYSTEAPVDEGYDGSSASVIATFLEKKAGYCVHFSSAMATMARTLGIPARIGVGFTTGTSELDLATRTTKYTVSTDDLHAWPELYFDTIGWVRFEPTPGRGSVPNFGSLDDPSTPDIDESNPTSAATATPTPTTAASATPTPTAVPDAASIEALAGIITTVLAWVGIALAVLILLLLPAIIRSSRRSRRTTRVRGTGSPLDAWAEVRDTALDLGTVSSDAETPRALATRLSAGMTPRGVEPLARLLAAVESHAYGQAGQAKLADGAAPRGGATVSDLRTTLAALRGHAGRSARWRALLLPASVLARFRRTAVGVDVHDE